MKLWMKVLIAMVAGVLFGLLLGEKATFLKPVGTAFISLISMIITPLVLTSMTTGVASIHDPKKIGRVGFKTLLYYFLTTLLAVSVGLIVAKFFSLGGGLQLTSAKTALSVPTTSLSDIVLSLVPKNPFLSMAEGHVLQIIVFSLFLGFSISLAGDRGRPVYDVMQSLAEVMYKVTGMVMEFSPIGVFAIMAWVAGSFGLEVILPLMKFVVIFYITCVLFLLIVMVSILRMAGLKPLPFFKGISDALLVAFSTGSSSAALPVSMRCVESNLGVSKSISSFVLPLGSTVNMNGTALFQAMSAIFVSHAYGIELSWTALSMVMITASLSAVGTAGIPGSGLIMLSAVLSSAGLPLDGIAILAGIDRLRDMIGTLLNVAGDAVVAVVIAKQEGEMDIECYNHEGEPLLEGSEV